MTRVIPFVSCCAFEETLDAYLSGRLDKHESLARNRHAASCESCRSLQEEWSDYFLFMAVVGRDIAMSHAVRNRLKSGVSSTLSRFLGRCSAGLAWCLHPVQVACSLFFVVLFTSLFVQWPATSDKGMALGNVMTVQAKAPLVGHAVIRYHWFADEVNQASFRIVLECFSRTGFSLYDPDSAANPALDSLLSEPRHRYFFKAWCGILRQGLGSASCSPAGKCSLLMRSVGSGTETGL